MLFAGDIQKANVKIKNYLGTVKILQNTTVTFRQLFENSANIKLENGCVLTMMGGLNIFDHTSRITGKGRLELRGAPQPESAVWYNLCGK